MSLFTTPGDITITSHKRITPWLVQELETLGITAANSFVTGVHLRGTINDCILLNCQLRCASQVLYSLGRFKASNADEVYRHLSRFEWENILPEGGYFSVTSNVQNDTINNSMFANLRVKDAIADRLRTKRGARPSTGAELSGAVIHLFWKEDEAEIFIDTSGHSLARHGYRKIPGQAPMLEALASAVIYATKWNRVQPFINPMCGSGTLAIEAAMIATNRKPGLFRDNYAFMHLKGYDEEVYRQQDALLELQIKDNPKPRIIATDYSEQAIENARKNAVAAGVADMIEFKVCDFAETTVPTDTGGGVVMFNPEYGERLGTVAALEDTYARIGDFMKKSCGGYYGYIFTGNLDLAKKIGLKASRRIEFYNSTIDCRLLEYELYSGSKKVTKQQDAVEDKTVLRLATEPDANALSKAMEALINAIPYYNELAKQHETERYSANSLADKIKEDPYAVIIAETDKQIAGFCVSRFDDYTIWLEWFGVTEDNRGKGITKKLLQKLEETITIRKCHKIWCDCRTTNQAAIHILSEAGYTQIATIPNHWYKQDFILWQKFVEK
ncbi:MAG: GNAT family N-acetyltransferase [Chitinophagaceae bacterium]